MAVHAKLVGVLAAGLGAALTLPARAAGQFRNGSPPDDLGAYEWTSWLVGDWEGIWESAEGALPYRQRFEFSPDRRYVITHNQRGEGPAAYRGFGVFSYYPVTGEAYGEWFGTNHDTNAGWADRDGERMVWTIRRYGLRITRTRVRSDRDHYTVENEIRSPDGSIARTREVMHRVASSRDPSAAPGAGDVDPDGLEAAKAVALEMPRAIDYAEWGTFLSLFADDAVMFFPFAPQRADGRDQIARVMKPIFDRNRERLPGPLFGFEPTEVVVAPLGPDGALVAWVMTRGGVRHRRSAALRREQGIWKIVLVHADNWPTTQDR